MAVAPPGLCAVSSAAAVVAVAIEPATTSPEATVTAATRTAPRLHEDHLKNDAENEETTEIPFEQDPLTWGVVVPPAESEAP
ncbi:hypothetical protein SGFS_075880 [Streptomyces graminofaciens]|uniref:Secreted protein n=1 Tax=Streptomyces graminofaciens TaxID=68212 RepID=A0ABN5VSB9_9ACTN|nr:hypothetical protein SGFS_075880 [Streptomyces graminofaciens]